MNFAISSRYNGIIRTNSVTLRPIRFHLDRRTHFALQQVRSFADVAPNTNQSKPPPPPPSRILQTETREEANKRLRRTIGSTPPPFMRLWAIIGTLGFIGAVVYYLSEEDQHDQKINGAIRLLSNPDLEARKLALKTLEECLFEQKVLLSTVVDVPQPKSHLVQQGAVEALFDAYTGGDFEIKEKCLVWLIRLAKEEDGRTRILRVGINPLLESIKNVDGTSTHWLTATSLLVELSKHKDSVHVIATPEVAQVIKKLQASSNPVARLASGTLISSISEADRTIPFQSDELSVLTTGVSVAALKAAIAYVIPKEPVSGNPALNVESTSEVLLRAGAFGLIGSVYGRFRWWLHARRSGLRGSDEVRKFLNKRSKTGRYVFSLMAMDVLAQALMLWPKEGIVIPLISNKPLYFPDLGMPQTTAIPIGEAGLVVLLSLWAIRYQRYVVLPLLLASWNAHWDAVDYHTKPIQHALGIDVNKLSSYIYGQVKIGVESAAEATKEAVKGATGGSKDEKK